MWHKAEGDNEEDDDDDDGDNVMTRLRMSTLKGSRQGGRSLGQSVVSLNSIEVSSVSRTCFCCACCSSEVKRERERSGASLGHVKLVTFCVPSPRSCALSPFAAD